MSESQISFEFYRQPPMPHAPDSLWDPLLVTLNWRLKRLRRHVDTNFGRSLSFTQAADICGLEKTYFCRFFQVQTGITFTEWLMRMRIQRAKNLLAVEHRTIAEVATAVGYKDITTFTRHFKKCEMLSPTDYRKHQRTAPFKCETTIAADKYTMAAETPLTDPTDNCVA